jgi:hypothetical protein
MPNGEETQERGAHHKKWYGNERIQELLAGPFYGIKCDGVGRATEIDHALRRYGEFSVRYHGEYVVCSGPDVLTALVEKILTPEEADMPMYQGENLADCIAEIFHGEEIKLAPGYNEQKRALEIGPRPPSF